MGRGGGPGLARIPWWENNVNVQVMLQLFSIPGIADVATVKPNQVCNPWVSTSNGGALPGIKPYPPDCPGSKVSPIYLATSQTIFSQIKTTNQMVLTGKCSLFLLWFTKIKS